MIEHFSQRRAEIEAALKAKGVDIDDASAQQKEDATLKTRARKVDVDHEALIGSWKERAKEIGIDFDAIQAKADAQRAQGGVIRADKLTGREAMSFAAAHLIEREAVVSKNDLMAAAIEHGAGRVSASEVKRAFDKLEKDGDLVYHLTQADIGTLHLSVIESCYSARLFTFEGTDHLSDPFEVCGEFTVTPPHAAMSY